MNVLRARAVDVHLGRSHILHQVDLRVSSGEVVALLGANGSGKSTLLRACLGLVPLSAGSVQLFDTPLGRVVPWQRIGYVPQRPGPAGGLPATAAEVVRTGLLSRGRLWPGRDGKSATMAALASVGLADRADRAVHELSGGQQQRVSIARALVRRPDLLLLDEPMAGVDQASQEVFAELLGDLKTQGITAVVVLHELGMLHSLIDRAVVLRQGRVVHDGALPEAAPHHDQPDHEHLHADHGEYQSEPDPLQVTLP